jgi:hypothetical protein
VRENDLCRVVVNVEILQRAVAVEIDRDLLRPVSAVDCALAGVGEK